MTTTTSKPFDLITSKTSHELDTGWAWVVMMGAFGSLFIVIGFQRSFGLLFVAFQEKYGYSSAHLSAVNGAQMLTYSFSTMFVMNFLLKKISIRTSCMLGAIIQTAGIIASSVHSDMVSLIIFQGVFFGLGHSMLFCPTILIVSQYFDKKRSIATAVALCGASIGGISFPYISSFLLQVFDVEGALLVLGALIFNQCVFYALYQPIVTETVPDDSTLKPSTDPDDEVQQMDSPTIVVETVDENGDYNQFTERSISEKDTSPQQNRVVCNKRITSLKESDTNRATARLSSSQTLAPSDTDTIREGNDRLYSSHSVLSTHLLSNRVFSNKSKFFRVLGNSGTGLDHVHSSLPALIMPLDQQKVDGNGDSWQFLPDKMAAALKDGVRQIATPIIGNDDTAVSLLGDQHSNSISEDEVARFQWIPQVMRLRSFWLIALYNVGGIIAAGCPAIFIPPLAKEKGLDDSDATFFLTISAVTDLLMRVGVGVVLHCHWIEPCTLALIPLALSTLFFNLTPLFNDFFSVMVLTLQYGLSSSMYWTLQSLVILEVLGLSNLGSALGFYAVISGVTTSASFPIAGWLRDDTGSYSSSFHFFGAMSSLAAVGLLLVVLPRYCAKCNELNMCSRRKESLCTDASTDASTENQE